MKTITSRATLAALLCSAIVGCSLFAPRHKAPPPAPPPPPPPPEVPQPTANQRFELNPGDDVVGSVQVVQASKEDTLADIARRFNVGYEEIVRANPKVDPWLPGEGTEIVVPSQFILPDAPHTGLVINIPAMRIFYFPPAKKGEKQVVFTHPIGIGKMGWKTPEGVTRITRRQKDPTWHVPVSVRKEHHENGDDLQPVIGPGPDNPLGRYAFYLEWPSYLIHGTNKPSGVGLRSSHGCMRLYPEDIEQFFNMIPVGTQVRVVNQPFVVGIHDGQLYLQPYDALEDDTRDWKKSEQKLLAKSVSPRLQQQLQAHRQDIDWNRVTALSQSPRGIPVRISGADASLEQVLAAAPRVQNTLPDGSSWDGKSDLPMDETTFKQMMSDAEPKDGAEPAAAAATPAPADAKPAKAHPTTNKSGG
jgi:L,D-transpeptidase ErfK/SrfK